MDAFKRAVGLLSFDSCFHVFPLSMFHSLPNSKILLDENSRVVTKQRF